MPEIKFTKKQFEKMADQSRLLSWAQGAILTSASGFKLHMSIQTVGTVVGMWVFLQIVALILDKRSEEK